MDGLTDIPQEPGFDADGPFLGRQPLGLEGGLEEASRVREVVAQAVVEIDLHDAVAVVPGRPLGVDDVQG